MPDVSRLGPVPEDRAGLDRALVTGSPLAELGDSALVRGISALADAVVPASARPPTGKRRQGRSKNR